MEYFTEKGRTHDEVMQNIRSKYGSDITILSRKSISMGGFLGLFQKNGFEYSGYVSSKSRLGLSRNDRNEKDKILNSLKAESKKDESFKKILDEVKSLKEELKNTSVEQGVDLESLTRIERFLAENDFSISYIKKILSRLKTELPYSQLSDSTLVEDKVMEWVEESISIFKPKPKKGGRVFVLVGPTGVGKTTTIAKLAAQKGLGLNGSVKNSVRIITIDNYRIGARMQIESYGNIMDIPVTCCESFDDIKAEVDSNRDVDFIFVDTTGRSPKDFAKLGEMRSLLEGAGQDCEVHLAFSASTKTWDIREIMKQYKPFGYQSVIVTKLDETTRCGNLISLLEEERQPISYITTGQDVPVDIEVASKKKILSLLVKASEVVKG